MPDAETTLSPDEVHELFERFSTLMSRHAEAVRLYEAVSAGLHDLSGDPKELAYIHFVAGHGYIYGPPPNETGAGLAAWKRALDLDPRNSFYASNFIISCQHIGLPDDLIPVASWMKDIQGIPSLARSSHESLIYALACKAEPTQRDQLNREAKTWAERHIAPQRPPVRRYKQRRGRPLRVGFIHHFFDRAAYHGLFVPLFKQLNRSRVTSYCYSTCPNDEAVPPMMRDAPDRWRAMGGMSDETIYDFISADGLDVLINLDGFHQATRFDVLAKRPAKIMATWHNTSHTFGGLFDYMIADEIVVPEGHDALFTETVLRTRNCYFAMEPMRALPERGPAPFLANGHVTFGSLNRPEKMNSAVIGSWKRIMTALPESRLLLRNVEYSKPYIQAHWFSALVDAGIGEDRITILGNVDDFEFVGTYNSIDIALDPFPFNGGTTTYQALWMGVPTVTWTGEHWAGRVSASVLTYAGLSDLVADSVGGYEALAIRLASEPPRLQGVRARIGDILARQPHMQTPQFAEDMMDVLERMAADFESRTVNL